MEPKQWDELQAEYGTDDGFTDRSLKGMWFTFDGRLNRMRYFLRALPVYLLLGAVGVIVPYVFWLVVLYVPLLWSLLSLISRRAHDIGYRPWLLMLLHLIPLTSPFTALYLCFVHGAHGPNAYGLDPTEYPYDI